MGVSDEKPKSKEERIKDFIKSIRAVDQAMEPFKEQRRDLKKNYVENGWLDKNEMSNLTKAMRLVKDDTDFDALQQMYEKVKGA